MNNEFENENKNKSNEEKMDEENYEDENEAAENSLETEEESEVEMPPFTLLSSSGLVVNEGGKAVQEEKTVMSIEEKRNMLAREKWMSVTGRKPRNIPTVKRCLQDEAGARRIEFFGDRRPAQIEKERKKKWIQLITNEVYKKTGTNFGVLLKEQGLPHAVESLWCLRFHPNGEQFSSGFRNGGVQVRDSLTCKAVLTLTTLESSDKLPISTLRYYPLDATKLYAGGATGNVQVFDLETETSYAAEDNVSQINVMDFNVDGTVLAIGGRNGVVSTLDPSTLKVTSMKVRPNIDSTTRFNIDEDFHRLRIYSVKFHPMEPFIFLTGGWDRVVKIWDVRVPTAVRSINGPFICNDAIDVNGNTILTASWSCENSIQLWDFASGNLVHQVHIQTKTTKFDGEFLYTAQFYKDGTEEPSNPRLVAVGGSGFNEVAVVKVPCGKIVASFPAYKAVTCLDTCGPYLVYGGKESLLRLGKIHLPKKY